MNIGINALFNANGGSLINLQQLLLTWYVNGVCRKHNIIIFASESSYDKLKSIVGDIYKFFLVKRCNTVFSRILIEQSILPLLMIKHKLDVLFCPANTMPLFTNIPCVVTFQNAAPFCDNINSATVGIKKAIKFYLLGIFIRFTTIRANHVIYISYYFRNLLVKRYGFDAKRGSVIYRAKTEVESSQPSSFVMSKFGIESDFIFTVSHLIAYKNIKELILAYSLASKSYDGKLPKLLIAGGEYVTGYKDEIQLMIDSLSLQEKIILLGNITHNDVAALLQNCLFFIFTSTCENCPTALIEAMSARKPIACSNVGVMPEIAGQAAHYFDPFLPENISQVIISMSSSEIARKQLQCRLDEELEKFPSQVDAALQTMQVIESVFL